MAVGTRLHRESCLHGHAHTILGVCVVGFTVPVVFSVRDEAEGQVSAFSLQISSRPSPLHTHIQMYTPTRSGKYIHVPYYMEIEVLNNKWQMKRLSEMGRKRWTDSNDTIEKHYLT